ncbi:uncharacterized protein LOC142795790 isoform X1 [Rhipicephalus microplus]|uniref:uncharacterized protein LOC142795790 isoform X1 n=1 Tax=Rhipicephalus microplus TaxID=6941 RepID=UPI003F6C7D2E
MHFKRLSSPHRFVVNFKGGQVVSGLRRRVKYRNDGQNVHFGEGGQQSSVRGLSCKNTHIAGLCPGPISPSAVGATAVQPRTEHIKLERAAVGLNHAHSGSPSAKSVGGPGWVQA